MMRRPGGSLYARALLAGGLALGCASVHAQTPGPRPEVIQAYQELFAASQKDKKGLTFFVKGQSIPGVVTKVIGTDAVEVRNQTHGRIIIRIDQIDAVAAN